MHRLLLPVVLLSLLSGCASLNPLNALERRMLFQPSPLETMPPETDFESVAIPVTPDINLHGIFLQHPEPQGVLLYCHGNAGHIVDRLDRLRQLRSRYRLTVLGFDYRGYGRSQGRPSEEGLYEDARAARHWLASHSGVAESDVILLGRSLGGGVAVELASSDGAKGLILENTFSSVVDVGKSKLSWLPASAVSQRFDSVSKIVNYHGPLLQTHGSRDRVIPFEFGNRLFKHANDPKAFVTASGGHNDAPSAEYEHQLGTFFHMLSGSYSPPTRVPLELEFNCQPNALEQDQSMSGEQRDVSPLIASDSAD